MSISGLNTKLIKFFSNPIWTVIFYPNPIVLAN